MSGRFAIKYRITVGFMQKPGQQSALQIRELGERSYTHVEHGLQFEAHQCLTHRIHRTFNNHVVLNTTWLLKALGIDLKTYSNQG